MSLGIIAMPSDTRATAIGTSITGPYVLTLLDVFGTRSGVFSNFADDDLVATFNDIELFIDYTEISSRHTRTSRCSPSTKPTIRITPTWKSSWSSVRG